MTKERLTRSDRCSTIDAMIMKLTGGALALVALGVACGRQGAVDDRHAAQEALRIERRVEEALGGTEAWEAARFVDFVWAANQTTPDEERPPLERRHVWDRVTGRYKLVMATPEGELTALFDDIDIMEGNAWIDGVPVEDTLRLDSLLRRSRAAFVHDTYWLLLPFMLRDPGVTVQYLGATADESGKQWETLQLTFDSTMTARTGRSLVYVDPESFLIGWWEHFGEPDMTQTNTRTRWLEWEQRGPLLVSLDRPMLDGTQAVFFPRVEISTVVREQAFAPPSQ